MTKAFETAQANNPLALNMKHLITLVFVAAVPLSSVAAPLDAIVEAMQIPASTAQTNSDWASLERANGVRWSWPASKAGEHDHTMSGTIRIPGVGMSSVDAIGARSFLTAVQVVMPEGGVEMNMIGKRAERMATTCDSDSISHSVALYRLPTTTFKPIFVAYESSQGSAGAGDTAFTFAADPSDALSAVGPNCRVKK